MGRYTPHVERSALSSREASARIGGRIWTPGVRDENGNLVSYVPLCMRRDEAMRKAQEMADELNGVARCEKTRQRSEQPYDL